MLSLWKTCPYLIPLPKSWPWPHHCHILAVEVRLHFDWDTFWSLCYQRSLWDVPLACGHDLVWRYRQLLGHPQLRGHCWSLAALQPKAIYAPWHMLQVECCRCENLDSGSPPSQSHWLSEHCALRLEDSKSSENAMYMDISFYISYVHIYSSYLFTYIYIHVHTHM